MTALLWTILGVSATGGVFILAAILVRAGMKNRLPRHFLVLLWAAVLVHLLVPAGMPSPTSIYNYVAVRRPSAQETTVGRELANPAGNAAVNPEERAGWARALPIVWLAGMAILGAGFAFCYWTTRRRFDDAILLKGDPAVERWLRGRKRPVRVYVSDRTATPLSCGLLRPRIILPLDFARDNAAQIESVLEHEYVHGSHYHNIMKFFVSIAVIVHWFNPLVWLFQLLFNHDLELACDERALSGMGAHRKAEYAHSLVAVAERVVTPLPLVSAFNARNLRERIVDVMGFKRAAGYWLIPELLLVALLLALFGTTPAVPAAVPETASAVPAAGRDSSVSEEHASLLPISQMGELAIDAVGGGDVREIELKRTKRGGFQYEVTVWHRNREYEVELDAQDGRVLEIDD